MVDILLATYNGEKYIGQQIESLITQSYREIRIIIRDDGSTDNTLVEVNRYRSKHPDLIHVVCDNSDNKGVVHNFCKLLDYATSDYIMFCDQDDYWFSDKIETILHKMEELQRVKGKHEPILVFSDYFVADERLRILENVKHDFEKSKVLNQLLVDNCVTGCTLMANRACYEKFGVYSPHILMHDWWMALYATACGTIYHLDEKLMYYRQHNDNTVGAVDIYSIAYIRERIKSGNTRTALSSYIMQAEVFLDRYGSELTEESKKILERFIGLKYKNKISRVYTLLRYNYLKTTAIRRIGQLVYA